MGRGAERGRVLGLKGLVRGRRESEGGPGPKGPKGVLTGLKGGVISEGGPGPKDPKGVLTGR